jgi:hypothetical protein
VFALEGLFNLFKKFFRCSFKIMTKLPIVSHKGHGRFAFNLPLNVRFSFEHKEKIKTNHGGNSSKLKYS